MPRSLKLTLYAVAALLAAAALTAAIMLLSWRVHAKPQVEAAASDALGMQVSVGGALALKFFPSVAMTLDGAAPDYQVGACQHFGRARS